MDRYQQSFWLNVDCPKCGKPNNFDRKYWIESTMSERDRLKRKYPPVVPESRECTECHAEVKTTEWHRSYERAAFAERGVVTPRMMKS